LFVLLFVEEKGYLCMRPETHGQIKDPLRLLVLKGSVTPNSKEGARREGCVLPHAV
jgi:hypothetical protein